MNSPATASDNTPVGGYAPGFYWCACRDCGLRFHGAKLSHQCRPCALAAASAPASPAGPAPDDGLVEDLNAALSAWREFYGSEGMETADVLAANNAQARAALRAHTAQPAAGAESGQTVEALRTMLDRYLRLANSGDAGFWDPEEEPEVIAARAALTAALAAAPRAGVPEGWRLTQALTDVAAERRRQVEMAGAAACYALYRSRIAPAAVMAGGSIEAGGPWASEWRKPTSRRRDLVKTGALILAEIERLDRAAAPQPEESK